MAQPPPPPGKGGLIVILLIAVLGGAIVYASIGELVRGESLGEGAVTVDARVVDTRVMTSRKRGDSYEVRYAFDVSGHTYSYSDVTGRRDLWVSLEESAWETARTAGKTEVQYLPRDPWNNRPLHQASEPVFGAIAGGVVGLVLMLPAVLWLVGLVRKRPTA